MKNKLVRVLAPVAVLAASVGIFMLLQATRPQPEQNDEPPRPTSVYTAIASVSSAALDVHTQGEVRSRTEIDLIAQVAGRIAAVSPEFVEGGRVEPGVALLQIEDTDYRLALSQAEARLAEAELAIQQALADQDVARKQLRNDPSASDLALKKPQVAQARALRAAAIAGLEQARLDLARTSVSLPFAGRVATTHVHVGQYIGPGAVLGKVFGTGTVEIRLPLNDGQLAALGLAIGYTAAEGEGLPVAFQARVAGVEHHWQGRLVRLDASVDPETRMLYGTAQVDDPYGAGVSDTGMPMAVGLFVEARIQGRQLDDALRIPASALRPGDQVFVINGESLLEIRRVQVAHQGPEYAIISGGLQAGDVVVTSAVRNPIQGMALVSLSQEEV